ncbi:MAG: hypothetical protein WAT19_13630 [Ferruginibacter sp.]
MIKLNTKKIVFKVSAVLFFIAAVYHGAGIFFPVNESPAWRHLLFVFICLFGVVGCIKRPPVFLYFIGLLSLQQYYSHGSYLIKIWKETHHIHFISVAVLIFLTVLFFILLNEKKRVNSPSA